MKSKIFKTVFPPVSGILAVFGLLAIFNLVFHDGDAFTTKGYAFLGYFLPFAALCAMTIQLALTLPFWNKFKTRKKVWGMTIVPFTTLVCLVSGLAFGLVFWETSYGFREWVAVTLTGIIAFSVYWAVNLFVLTFLDKRLGLA